jgi:hypothetical protein
MQGVQYACQNPDKAAANTLKFVPSMPLASARAGIVSACSILWTPEAKEHGLGYMTEAAGNQTLDFNYKYTDLSKSVKADIVIDDQFIPDILPTTNIQLPN